jgi:hypothetical protein
LGIGLYRQLYGDWFTEETLGDSQNVHLRIVNPAARSVLATEFGVFVFKLPLEKW